MHTLAQSRWQKKAIRNQSVIRLSEKEYDLFLAHLSRHTHLNKSMEKLKTLFEEEDPWE